MACINDMPDEVLEFIISYLPPYRDLERCMIVCKRWNNIAKNVLRRTHINLQKGLYESRVRWYSESSPPIAGRFSHAAVLHNNSMYIFGGGSAQETTFNDLWRYDLSLRQWIRLSTMGSYPSPKACASMVCYNNLLILFGGWRHPSEYPPHQPWILFDELHVYDINENKWNNVTKASGYRRYSPPPITGHGATIFGSTMVLFGGYQHRGLEHSKYSNDIWCLNLKTFEWSVPTISDECKKPQARYGHVQIKIDDNHLLIMGGCGGPNNIYNDAWILTIMYDNSPWIWKTVEINNKYWAANQMWCNPACKVGTKIVVLGPTLSVPPNLQIVKNLTPSNTVQIPINRNPVLPAAFGDININMRFHNIRQRQHNPQLQRQLQQQQLQQQQPPQQLPQPPQQLPQPPQQLPQPPQQLPQPPQQLQPQQPEQIPQQQERQPNQRDDRQHIPLENNHFNENPPANSIIRHGENINLNNRAKLNSKEIDATNRLQRNLQLRNHYDDNDHYLPKRFNEPLHDRLHLSAFNVNNNQQNSNDPREKRLEALNRMKEKFDAMQRTLKKPSVNNDDKQSIHPSPSRSISLPESSTSSSSTSPSSSSLTTASTSKQSKKNDDLVWPPIKRIKSNRLGMFICDISNILNNPPTIEWVECKNFGALNGAPEKLMLSSIVAGNGELIVFGGVRKEMSHPFGPNQVSNTIHFVNVPQGII